MHAPNHDPTRLLARLLRGMLAAERFTSDADVKAALKDRCARLRIAYDSDTIDRALDLVASNTRLSTPDPPTTDEPAVVDPPVTRDEARALLKRFGVAVRRVPAVRELTPDEYLRQRFDADRARALQLVTDAILESDARCDALESEKP